MLLFRDTLHSMRIFHGIEVMLIDELELSLVESDSAPGIGCHSFISSLVYKSSVISAFIHQMTNILLLFWDKWMFKKTSFSC